MDFISEIPSEFLPEQIKSEFSQLPMGKVVIVGKEMQKDESHSSMFNAGESLIAEISRHDIS